MDEPLGFTDTGYLCTQIRVITLGFMDNPYPSLRITRIRVHRYGFARIRVRVGPENPRVIRGNP